MDDDWTGFDWQPFADAIDAARADGGVVQVHPADLRRAKLMKDGGGRYLADITPAGIVAVAGTQLFADDGVTPGKPRVAR